MTKIGFDEPSTGSANAGQAALTVSNSGTGQGLVSESVQGEGIRGVSHSDHGAVVGVNVKTDSRGDAGWFESTAGEGCHGVSHSQGHGGVVGINDYPGTDGGASGVYGESTHGEGVRGISHSPHGAVVGVNDNTGPGIYGENRAHGPAGFFQGNVIVTGDLQLSGGDLAEQFAIAEPGGVEAGTVMILDGDDQVRASSTAYDRRVAGVVAGAGTYRPGLVLDHRGRLAGRQPLALVGKVFCKVDASFGPIETGDLLTTSPNPGHAMKASDPAHAFGAVLGKAMAGLAEGVGLVPVLVTLH
jgi:hypothetical protein